MQSEEIKRLPRGRLRAQKFLLMRWHTLQLAWLAKF